MEPPVLVAMLQLGLLCAALALLAHYARGRWTISRFATLAAGRATRPLDVVLELAGVIHSTLPRIRDPAYLSLEFLPWIGASPTAVLRSGACCSGLTRLFVTSLHALGIRATQITLYHASGAAQHCVAEVIVCGEPVLVDAMYGFYYLDADGRPFGLEALRAGAVPRFHALPRSTQSAYPANEYYRFDFSQTKTANWTMSATRRAVYQVLSPVTLGRIDTVRQPALFEWPQLVLASGMLTLFGFTLLLAAF